MQPNARHNARVQTRSENHAHQVAQGASTRQTTSDVAEARHGVELGAAQTVFGREIASKEAHDVSAIAIEIAAAQAAAAVVKCGFGVKRSWLRSPTSHACGITIVRCWMQYGIS
ncbi:hypothetical protein [Burkholderia diffusa]|uniref:hypothetical protein n=1 Tax=Burkholderia diffusa TaxID=488732 RepID=UPI00158F5E61|nr:hypothetical protein [Burkholderia diffusa]